ncbi:hypothetical protein PWKp5_00085 [Klebsiella phage PWKp5]|nr:hypothetical protein PWKp5_00085 [Klebsiella phage PWKp5]
MSKQLLPHQERVVQEKEELEKKYNALGAFREGDTFKSLSTNEQFWLNSQHYVMGLYLHVLNERINRF